MLMGATQKQHFLDCTFQIKKVISSLIKNLINGSEKRFVKLEADAQNAV